MILQFSALPKDKPSNTIKEGFYIGTADEVSVRTAKTSGVPYLNIKWKLKDEMDNNKGCLFDMVSLAENTFCQYKLNRLVLATGTMVQDGITEHDLAKLLRNAQAIFKVVNAEGTDGRVRSQIDNDVTEIYLPTSEFNKVFNGNDEDIIDAPDAEDAVSEPSGEEFNTVPANQNGDFDI